MPGSGTDTQSPWRQGPDWKAGNIRAMERCIVLKEKEKDKKRGSDGHVERNVLHE